jgi:hypothetical protein
MCQIDFQRTLARHDSLRRRVFVLGSRPGHLLSPLRFGFDGNESLPAQFKTGWSQPVLQQFVKFGAAETVPLAKLGNGKRGFCRV